MFASIFVVHAKASPPKQIVKVFPVGKRYPEESWKLYLDKEACTCAKTTLHSVAVLCCFLILVVPRFSLPVSFLLSVFSFPVAGVSLAICNEFIAHCPWEPELH